MSGQKNSFVTFGFVLSISLIASAISVMFLSSYDSRLQFDLLNEICGEMVEQEPETKKIISAALKEYISGNAIGVTEADLLSSLGYHVSHFSASFYRQKILFVTIGFLTGAFLFICTFLYRNKIEASRIRALADYLEQVHTDKAPILSASGEDDFSKLEDEIYKTVTFLYQVKDAAMQAKNDYANNLFNIAHQIKTKITAISLSIQMMKQDFDSKYLEKAEKQLLRLARLEEALLILSRIDAGTLLLQKNEEDVFTILVLAADHLQELFEGSGTSIHVPELGARMIVVDLDWTMEAFMNLMKNCMEHSKGGTIHCSYAQNPLYTEICIWDDGEGFVKEDMPHLFERFYRGQNANGGGIGIGLALSKEIIERQNGTIRAKNMPGGGACFEIRFYSH